jgi:hypothetical protein
MRELTEEHASGNVRLISGTDVSSTEAGGDFITNESSILSLRKALGVGEAIPTLKRCWKPIW